MVGALSLPICHLTYRGCRYPVFIRQYLDRHEAAATGAWCIALLAYLVFHGFG